MHIAIFSDVHGNPYACEAVLEAIRAQDSIDSIVFAGDLCLGGSDPAHCIYMLREANVITIYGNTEVYINHPEEYPKDENHYRKWDELKPAVDWVRSRLTSQQLDWLNSLPFQHSIFPTQEKKDELLVVHANPKNVEIMIYPDEEQQQALLGKVIQPDDDPDLIKTLTDTQARIIAFGHYHYPSQRLWKNKLLVNVGPCSLPGVDYNLHAHYSSFTFSNGEWSVSQHSIEYDVDREIWALRNSDMPSKDFFISYFGA
jgi:predicted phosphodiesterase